MDQEMRLRFISIFDEFPALWNKSCKEFRFFQKQLPYRNQVWKDVMRRFGEEGISVSEERLRQSWVQLRNEFIRYKFPSELKPAKETEDNLHESLNNLTQQLFREDSIRETSFFEQKKINIEASAETWNPNFGSSKKQDTQMFEDSRYPELEIRTNPQANQATTQDFSQLNNLRTESLAESTDLPCYETLPTAIEASTVSIACQTEEILHRRVSLPKKLPTIQELASIRVTFSRNKKGRDVSLEDSLMKETVYDEVATLKETEYDTVATMTWSHDSGKIFKAL